jgi:low temperature requirement protein LtrA
MHVSDYRGPLRTRNGGEQRVTPLELFFDLVYVFAVTQLSHRLLEHLSLRGVLETLMLFLVVWGVWVYTAWFTNWFHPDRLPVRLVLVAVMLASLLMSVAIPEAFGKRGLMFALAYVAIQVGRAWPARCARVQGLERAARRRRRRTVGHTRVRRSRGAGA